MAIPSGTGQTTEHVLPKGTVVIAGGGPVGLILATVLSYYGVHSILFERNKTTTHWPKMDLTNSRSMELFRKLGLADELRKQGVPSNYSLDVLFSNGMDSPDVLTKWDLPSVDEMMERIKQKNDGSMPLEPNQRMSQVVFERWLKEVCEKDERVDLRYGHRVDGVEEMEGGKVTTKVTEVDSGVETVYVSEYVAGCDGGGSRVRRSLDLPVDGGPIPGAALLVHFKSRDLTRLHKHGQFWHIFFAGPGGIFLGAIIAQDEVDTWTIHMFGPVEAEYYEKIDSHEAVYQVLGGAYGRYPIEIDEILVRSIWRPNIAVTRTWHSPGHRILLAGDAVHQNIPTGGYGMNMGIGDAFDLGWKLAAVIHGQGGEGLLRSYESERKPVASRNIERSGVHFQQHMKLAEIFAGRDPKVADQDTEEAKELRTEVHNHYQLHDNENKDTGVEMDNRYRSEVVIADEEFTEPPWYPKEYTPSTWPGSRAPHLFLHDGTAIFDRLGKYWTLLVFSDQECGQRLLMEAADAEGVPVKEVNLSREELAGKLYERKLVLVRPDHHVAWRADTLETVEEALRIVHTVTGRNRPSADADMIAEELKKPQGAFTATEGMMTQVGDFKVESMSEWQR